MTVRGLIILGLSCALTVGGFSQDRSETLTRDDRRPYRIEQTTFLPPVFYVGDVVELRLRISTDGVPLPSAPDTIPQADWITIHDVRIIPIAADYDVRIRFTSFRPGALDIPEISIGDVRLSPLHIDTASIRSRDTTDFRGVFDPMLLPGTKLVIGIGAGVLMFGPLVALLLFGWLRRTITSLTGPLKARRPYRILGRRLETLHASAPRMDSREFYRLLFDSFREYLTARSDRTFTAATTSETDRLAREEFDGIEPLEALSRLVPTIDRAKFGGAESPATEKLKGLELVRSAAAEIERRHRAGKTT